MRRALMKKARITDGILPIILILLISVAAEALFANFTYFAYGAGNDECESYVVSDFDAVYISGENNTLFAGIPEIPLHSVSFSVRANSDYAEDSLATARFGLYDENNVLSPSTVRSEKIFVGKEPRRVTAFMRSQGNAKGIEIRFADFEQELIVTDVEINPEYVFGFDLIRMSVIFLLLCAVYVLKTDGNGKKIRNSMTYGGAGAASVCVCAVACFAVWFLNASNDTGNCIYYPLEGFIENYSPYIQQFDAFMKGQLHFDVTPMQELLELENPYNPDAREGIYYLYDRAFFEGKYYSYFGIAPILVIYFPFYLLTGVLPTDSTVMGIFSLITSVFIPMAVVEWARYRNSGIRPWLSAVLAVGAFFASSALIIQRGYTPFYYIASLAGMAFVSAFVFWIIKALGENKKKYRIIFFALAGISFALAFLSRVNSVIVPAVMIAVFVIIYSIKKIKEKQFSKLVSEMTALALPVAVSLGFSLCCNYVRFGNPLQFGADYQLTIADASLYELGFDGIIPSVIHYFFQPFGILDEFPYIGFDYLRLSDYGRYAYIDTNFGIFAVPFMLSLFLSPFIFRSGRITKSSKALLASGIIALFATAFANFCLGGVIFRYTSDISLAAALVSAVILLEICTAVEKSRYAEMSSAVKKAAAALTAVTVIIIAAATVQLNGNLKSYDPDIYLAMKEFFVIWS